MTPTTRFSIGLPTAVNAPLATFARRAEELGFWSAWAVDHAVGEEHAEDPSLDPLHVMTHVAAVTTRLRVGVAVLILPRRNPAQLARDLATMDVLSGGRITVGVGLGGKDPGAAAFGFQLGMRAKQFVEGIGVMRALWAEGAASYRGDLYSFTGAHLQPKPVQRPHPPILIGARTPAALQRAAHIGDGWIGAGSSTREDFAGQTRVLRDALASAGRNAAQFPLAKRVYIAVEDDARIALARLAPLLDHVYRKPGTAERVAVYGSPSECAGHLHELMELGATELVLNPLYDELEQMEKLARVVEMLGV
jgi:probable F420-dependent oxidoreductase